MNTSTQLLLVEDNQTTADTLRLFLEAQGYAVTHAPNGRAAAERLSSGGFDLVVLDLMLPDVDGITLCRGLRRHSRVPVVMLTARSAEDDIVEGLEAGADDYVRKPFGSRELLARIKRCLERAHPAPPHASGERLRVGTLELDVARRALSVEGTPVKLTRSEFDILRGQLLDHALGPDSTGTDRTIDTHVWSLRKKLGEPRGQPRRILSEPGIGYRMNDDDAP